MYTQFCFLKKHNFLVIQFGFCLRERHVLRSLNHGGKHFVTVTQLNFPSELLGASVSGVSMLIYGKQGDSSKALAAVRLYR